MAARKKTNGARRSENLSDKKPGPYIGSKGVDLDRLREAKKEEKGRRKNDRRENERRERAKGKGVDWEGLDRLGEPRVSFAPGSAERPRLLEILARKKRDPERVALIAKLAREFMRVYSRYRGEAERNLRGLANYKPSDGETRFAATAAVLCIQKGVTPTRLIRYWDEHVSDFTDMKIPSLSFLSRVANVDTVACAPEKETRKKPRAGSSFSAIGGLHVGLRAELERAGYDTRAYNDRFLLGIQSNAIAIAEGRDIFIAKGKVHDMTHAAAALFEKVEE